MTERFLRAVGALSPGERLIRVKSWWPVWCNGELLGPLLLVEQGGQRMTIRRIYI